MQPWPLSRVQHHSCEHLKIQYRVTIPLLGAQAIGHGFADTGCDFDDTIAGLEIMGANSMEPFCFYKTARHDEGNHL